MNLSTTTLANPDWDLATILERYPAYGYRALDFRGCAGEMLLWNLPEFSRDLSGTAARISDAGLTVTCISTGIRAVGAGNDRRDEIESELDLVLDQVSNARPYPADGRRRRPRR